MESAAPSGTSQRSSKFSRKSGFSCEACRKRKVKCDGSTPSCTRCTARGQTCYYGIAPTLSYTRSLEKRIAELELRLAQSPQLIDCQDGDKPEPDGIEYGSQNHASIPASPGSSLSTEFSHSNNRLGLEQLQIDNGSQIPTRGAISFFQLPRELDDMTLAASTSLTESDGKDKLVSNAWKERAFERLANIPEPIKTLLDFHWTWIQPLFNFVYRPAFTRDMKSNGPYFSHTLLNTILSHSTRWARNDPRMSELLKPFDDGAQFGRSAVQGIFAEIQEGESKVPDIQALLLLSAQACSSGHKTQAWLYSGMAFRLIQSKGLNIDHRKFAGSVQATNEDIEIQNRLFWSCYSWEKLLCLYLGKSPTIERSAVSPPHVLLDDSAEIDVWSPLDVTLPGNKPYPPTQCHATSCFTRMCSLSEILSRVLSRLYNPHQQSSTLRVQECIAQEAENLTKWWDDLPNFLQILVTEPLEYCPPSHIATLNCLFHTVVILLHRRRIWSRLPSDPAGMADAVTKCVSSANAIMSIFDLYRRTFGDGHVVLALGYSVYSATSIFLLEAQAAESPSYAVLSQLRSCIDALERLKIISPIINTALRLIYHELKTLNIDLNRIVWDGDAHGESGVNSLQNTSNTVLADIDLASYEWSEFNNAGHSVLPVQWGDVNGELFLRTEFSNSSINYHSDVFGQAENSAPFT